jgi:hypothetical protein
MAGALVFAIVRLRTSGGGGYSDIFVLLGFLAFLFGAGAVYYAVDFRRRGQGAATATSLSVAAAITLVLFGLAAGFRG